MPRLSEYGHVQFLTKQCKLAVHLSLHKSKPTGAHASFYIRNYARENSLIILNQWKYNVSQSDIITCLKTTLIKIQI